MWKWIKKKLQNKSEDRNDAKPKPIPETGEGPLWFSIAKKELGVSEISGRVHNTRILQYHSATKLMATSDEVPWCSSFVSWCLEQANIPSTKNAWARSYLDWGVPVKTPVLGCIVVFTRSKNKGHVAFFVSEDENRINVLGGNQNNRVCIQSYPKKDLLGYRMPEGY